jgi:hypothetical protein
MSLRILVVNDHAVVRRGSDRGAPTEHLAEPVNEIVFRRDRSR